MHRPDARDTPDTLDQHPLDRVVTTRSEASAAMWPELARDGTRSVMVPSTLTNHTVSNNKIKSCMQCNNQVQMHTQITTKAPIYRFLMCRLSRVSYSQRGSDTKRCGTPAQSDRFTLHCQPRDHVFWQHTTSWYRKQPLY